MKTKTLLVRKSFQQGDTEKRVSKKHKDFEESKEIAQELTKSANREREHTSETAIPTNSTNKKSRNHMMNSRSASIMFNTAQMNNHSQN